VSETCKRSLEVTIPREEVQEEIERVVGSLKERVTLPGFRPGKVPVNIIRRRFAEDIREEVIRNLLPKHFRKAADDRNLRVVGTPDVTEVHYQEGEPLSFKAEFEVVPEFELQEYRGLTVGYREPRVTEEQIAERLEQLRERKAEFVNEAPRPLADGDFAVVALEAVGEHASELPRQEELVVKIGDPDTLPEFTESLRGLSPRENIDFDVRYPEDFGDRRLAGRTIRFHAEVKGIRRKELPELNDAFARDLGDFASLEDLREQVRKVIEREQELAAQQEAKTEIVNRLVDMHDFPVPEALLERQIRSQLEQQLRSLAAQGYDIDELKLDWNKVREAHGERAAREVKASLILERIAEREAIGVTMEELDREVERLAQQMREPAAALRKRLEEEGALGRIAGRIRTDKVLNFLFEQARKEVRD